MRFSTSSVVATMALGSTVSAQVNLPAGASNLLRDIQKLATDLTGASGNPLGAFSTVTGDVSNIIADVLGFAPGGVTTLPDGGANLVGQITTVVCPQLQSIESKIPNLPFPLTILTDGLRGIVKSIANQFLAAVNNLPSTGPVNTAPAIACLNTVVAGATTKRSGGATIPVEVAF